MCRPGEPLPQTPRAPLPWPEPLGPAPPRHRAHSCQAHCSFLPGPGSHRPVLRSVLLGSGLPLFPHTRLGGLGSALHLARTYPTGSGCGPASGRCQGSSSSAGTRPCAGRRTSSPAAPPCPGGSLCAAETEGVACGSYGLRPRSKAPAGLISSALSLSKHRAAPGGRRLPCCRALLPVTGTWVAPGHPWDALGGHCSDSGHGHTSPSGGSTQSSGDGPRAGHKLLLTAGGPEPGGEGCPPVPGAGIRGPEAPEPWTHPSRGPGSCLSAGGAVMSSRRPEDSATLWASLMLSEAREDSGGYRWG